MKIATAAYPVDPLPNWAAYVAKQEAWVREAALSGAGLLVFPEHAAMELAPLAPAGLAAAAADAEGSVKAVASLLPKAYELFRELAQTYSVHILAGSAPVQVGAGTVNRTPFFAPDGRMEFQDKQIMTRFERDAWRGEPGGGLKLFQLRGAQIGVLTCYDAQFPLLGRTLVEAGAEILLVPSSTGSLAGYWRVRLGAMARALEGQCITVQAAIVGDCPEIFGVEAGFGTGGVFGPPDLGFPPDGVIALGQMNQPGWTYGEADPEAVRRVRRDGRVLNHAHWPEQEHRVAIPERIVL